MKTFQFTYWDAVRSQIRPTAAKRKNNSTIRIIIYRTKTLLITNLINGFDIIIQYILLLESLLVFFIPNTNKCYNYIWNRSPITGIMLFSTTLPPSLRCGKRSWKWYRHDKRRKFNGVILKRWKELEMQNGDGKGVYTVDFIGFLSEHFSLHHLLSHFL